MKPLLTILAAVAVVLMASRCAEAAPRCHSEFRWFGPSVTVCKAKPHKQHHAARKTATVHAVAPAAKPAAVVSSDSWIAEIMACRATAWAKREQAAKEFRPKPE